MAGYGQPAPGGCGGGVSRVIFLDNAAGSWPKAPGVAEAMAGALSMAPNVARGGYGMAYELLERVTEIRQALSEYFGLSDPRRLIFTPGCTWSLNMVLRGLVKPGTGVRLAGLPHNAVSRPLAALGAEEGGEVTVLTHGSNVSGQLSEAPEESGWLVVDAAQTAGLVPIDFEAMGADALCFGAHKGLMGPQGLGLLLLSERLAEKLEPVIAGGTGSFSDSERMPPVLPDRFEPGTPNLPAILGLGAALDFIKDNQEEIYRRKQRQTALIRELFSDIDGVHPVARPDLPVVSLDFEGMDNAEAAFRLEQEYGILSRCGLHCAPAAHRALGTFPRGTVRLSAGFFTTEEELQRTAEAVGRIAHG